MALPNPTFIKFGEWLKVKRNFFLFFVVGGGIPFWLFYIWLVGVPNVLWFFFITAVSFGASFLAAFVMWHFFCWYFPSFDKRGE